MESTVLVAAVSIDAAPRFGKVPKSKAYLRFWFGNWVLTVLLSLVAGTTPSFRE